MIRNIHPWQTAPYYEEGQGSLAEQILLSRSQQGEEDSEGIDSQAEAVWLDPFAFCEMEQAVACLDAIRAHHGRILIHGDYDADGLTAAAILYRFLSRQGLPVEVYIPNRLEEGYGLSMQGVEHAVSNQVDLVITVDCGTNSVEEFAALRAAGIRTILTDHHQLLGSLPEADARLNPTCPELGYPDRRLSGAGVALKLVQALCISWGLGEQWETVSDLAALGTVADLMILRGENVCLVRAGLDQLRQNPCPGLQALMQQLRIEPGTVTEEQIGFQLAPRVNAAGRMGNTDPAWTLLTTEEPSVAKLAAQDLEELNRARRDLSASSVQEAREQIAANPQWLQTPLLVVSDPQWSPGILGLIAATLVQEYAKPTVALGGLHPTDENPVYSGSARTFGSVDLLSILQQDADLFVGCGGHRAAAGVRLTPEQLQQWRARLAEAKSNTPPEEFLPSDLTLRDLSALYEQSVLELQQQGPYGKGWPAPILRCYNLRVQSCQAVGANPLHWRLILEDVRGKRIQGIWFRGVLAVPWLHNGDQVQVRARPELSTWGGQKSLQLKIEDLQVQAIIPKHSGLPLAWQKEEPDRLRKRLGGIFHQMASWVQEGAIVASLSWIARALADEMGFCLSDTGVKNLIQLFVESAILRASFYSVGAQECCCLQRGQGGSRKRLSELSAWERIWGEEERDGL